jgi:hypothetical protein
LFLFNILGYYHSIPIDDLEISLWNQVILRMDEDKDLLKEIIIFFFSEIVTRKIQQVKLI